MHRIEKTKTGILLFDFEICVMTNVGHNFLSLFFLLSLAVALIITPALCVSGWIAVCVAHIVCRRLCHDLNVGRTCLFRLVHDHRPTLTNSTFLFFILSGHRQRAREKKLEPKVKKETKTRNNPKPGNKKQFKNNFHL